MSTTKPAPIYEPLIEDLQNPVPRIPWTLFFSQIYNGDLGTNWTPNFVNLTTVGTPTITGRYYQITRALSFFSVKIVPTTNTSATTGTTYIDNFPLRMTGDGACFSLSGLVGTSAGMCEQATNRIYPVGWTTVTVPLTIVGLVEAS